MKNVVIYLPNGKDLYFFIGASLIDSDKKELPFTVKKILEKDNKIIIYFSNGEIRTYANFHWSNINNK